MNIMSFTHATPTLLHGFLLYAGIVVAFGPQNLFVLQQGLRRQHLFVTALLCTLADLFLIGIGVGGMGAAISANHALSTITAVAGIVFLAWCGLRALRTAWRRQGAVALQPASTTALSLKGTVVAALGFAFLNPAAYVDTFLMFGAASGQYALDGRLLFWAGAVLAAGLWFFALTYGASRLAHLFHHPRAWQTLDVVSGCIMLGMAAALYASQLA